MSEVMFRMLDALNMSDSILDLDTPRDMFVMTPMDNGYLASSISLPRMAAIAPGSTVLIGLSVRIISQVNFPSSNPSVLLLV